MNAWLSLLLAAIFLLGGHVVRTMRWTLLFPASAARRQLPFFIALSLGYLLNLILPFHLGELLRIQYLADREKLRLAQVTGTVAVERLSDLLVVAPILCAMSVWGSPDLHNVERMSIQMGIIAIVSGVLISTSKTSIVVRGCIGWVAGIFNRTIRTFLQETLWATATLFAKNILINYKFIGTTICMWSLYFVSYFFLLRCLSGLTVAKLAVILFGPFSFLTNIEISSRKNLTLIAVMVSYALFPIAVGLVYGLIRDKIGIIKIFCSLHHLTTSFVLASSSSISDKFHNTTDMQTYLDAFYNINNPPLQYFGLSTLKSSIILRFYQGGSGAIAALIQDDDRYIIRKFSTDSRIQKLQEQVSWLQKHANLLPVTEVLRVHQDNNCFYYDMPFHNKARTFYEVIHNEDKNISQHILSNIIECISRFHSKTICEPASDSVVKLYIIKKCVSNVNFIIDCVRSHFSCNKFTINNATFDLNDWEFLMDVSGMCRRFTHLETCTIHGDLTIDNIIISPTFKNGWYCIDPNPTNIFNSPLIDWAKLYQSLHLGYETIYKNIKCTFYDNGIYFCPINTAEYTRLFSSLEDAIYKQVGNTGLHDIYLHEIINYLRLTPYKFKIDYNTGLLFFAYTCVLIKKYKERFEPHSKSKS